MRFHFHILVVLCLGLHPVALAQSAKQRISVQDIDVQLSSLISKWKIEQARELLEQHDPSELDRLFLEGRILKRMNRLEEAVIIFRSILSRDPYYLNARRELAHTLFVLKDYRRAEVNFERLLKVDPLEPMRDGYRNFLAVISREKPFSLSGYLNIFPSSNLNNGSSQVYVLGRSAGSIGNRAKFGVGVQLGLSGQYKRQLTPRDRIVLRLALDGARYESSFLDNVTTTLTLAHRHQVTTKDVVTLTPHVRFTWYNDETDSGQYDHYAIGLRTSLEHRINSMTGVSSGISAEYKAYPDVKVQNGMFSMLYVIPWHRESSGTTGSAGIRVSANMPDNRSYRYYGYTLTSSVSGTGLWGLNVNIRFELGAKDYQGIFGTASYVGKVRKDYFWKETVSLFHPRINYAGITPKLTFQYMEQYSNIEIFRYPVAYVLFSLTQEF